MIASDMAFTASKKTADEAFALATRALKLVNELNESLAKANNCAKVNLGLAAEALIKLDRGQEYIATLEEEITRIHLSYAKDHALAEWVKEHKYMVSYEMTGSNWHISMAIPERLL